MTKFGDGMTNIRVGMRNVKFTMTCISKVFSKIAFADYPFLLLSSFSNEVRLSKKPPLKNPECISDT